MRFLIVSSKNGNANPSQSAPTIHAPEIISSWHSYVAEKWQWAPGEGPAFWWVAEIDPARLHELPAAVGTAVILWKEPHWTDLPPNLASLPVIEIYDGYRE